MTFKYTAAGPQGKLAHGTVEAVTRAEAVKAVSQRGLVVLEMVAVASAAPPVQPPPVATAAPQPPPAPDRSPEKPPEKLPRRRARMSQLDSALFFRQLAVMFDAGLPLLRAVSTLAEQGRTPALCQALHQVAEGLAHGLSFSVALQRSGLFSPFTVGVVRAGEESGTLNRLLARLAVMEEQELAFRQQVHSRLAYPVGVAIAMVFATCLLTLLMGKVVGALGQLAEQSAWLRMLQQPWLPLAILGVPLAALTALLALWRRPAGRGPMEQVMLRIPALGPLLRRMESARLCRILSELVQSGLRVDRSLALAAGTTRSPLAAAALEQARKRLSEGEGLAESLRASGYFPREVVHMTAAGESSGRLPLMLGKVAQYSDLEVQRFLESATAALEPLLLAVLGVLVGLTMLATFTPIYGSLGRL